MRLWLLLSFTLAITPLAFASDLVVKLPDKTQIAVATAVERGTAVNVGGAVSGNQATFSKLPPDATYDLAIEQTDGLLLCGSDMSWCDETPADPNAEPLGDDDREQIRAIVKDIPQFGNKPEILKLEGSHDRAVALVESSRTKGFHSDSGDEVIWRVEVWYFKWQTGAWERVPNQNRMLRRERFKSKAAYEREFKRIRWVNELGGVHLEKDKPVTTVEVKSIDPIAPVK